MSFILVGEGGNFDYPVEFCAKRKTAVRNAAISNVREDSDVFSDGFSVGFRIR